MSPKREFLRRSSITRTRTRTRSETCNRAWPRRHWWDVGWRCVVKLVTYYIPAQLDIVPHMQTLLDFFSFQQAPLYFLRKQRFVYTLPISTSCCYKRICTPHFPTQVVLPHLSLSLFSPVPLASILLQICVVSVFSSVFPNSTCILSVNQWCFLSLGRILTSSGLGGHIFIPLPLSYTLHPPMYRCLNLNIFLSAHACAESCYCKQSSDLFVVYMFDNTFCWAA